MTTPTTSEVIAAHAEWKPNAGPQLLDRLACEAMGHDKRASHRCYHEPQDCVLCMAWVGSTRGITLDSHYCTRYTTDLTSIGEFEKAHLPVGYERNIKLDKSVFISSKDDGHFFHAPTLEVNWCAAILWAAAHEREREAQLSDCAIINGLPYTIEGDRPPWVPARRSERSGA